MDALAPSNPGRPKEALPPGIARFLLFFNGRGTTLVQPPAFDPERLVRDLINDRYDLSPFMESEPARRTSGTSSRRIAILKAGLAGDDRMARSALVKRMGQIETVLDHGRVTFEEASVRESHEIPGAVSYGETIRQQGKTGLSPGFVKDMVEIMGETPALSAFASYLESPALQTSRTAMSEMLGYMDRYLQLDSNRQRLVELARGLFSGSTDRAVAAAAAQYLVRKGAVAPAAANDIYERYFKGADVDVTAVGALLNAGLDRERAGIHFRGEIDHVDLNDPGAHQRLDELGRIARVLEDPEGQQRIVDKHEAFLAAFFPVEPSWGAGRRCKPRQCPQFPLLSGKADGGQGRRTVFPPFGGPGGGRSCGPAFGGTGGAMARRRALWIGHGRGHGA